MWHWKSCACSHASVSNHSALVAVIVVHYRSYMQILLLATNQDFRTQTWQKIRFCSWVQQGLLLHQTPGRRLPFSSWPPRPRSAQHRLYEALSLTYTCADWTFINHLVHADIIYLGSSPSNCAFTTTFTSVNACCTHVCPNLTAWHSIMLNPTACAC